MIEALAPATPDEAIVAYAVRTDRIVITQDTDDFYAVREVAVASGVDSALLAQRARS